MPGSPVGALLRLPRLQERGRRFQTPRPSPLNGKFASYANHFPQSVQGTGCLIHLKEKVRMLTFPNQIYSELAKAITDLVILSALARLLACFPVLPLPCLSIDLDI